MYYLIRNNLTECNPAELTKTDTQFVAVLRADEWEAKKDLFDMGIDMDLNPADIHSTKIEVNYDSLTGTFSLPTEAILWLITSILPSHWMKKELYLSTIPTLLQI